MTKVQKKLARKIEKAQQIQTGAKLQAALKLGKARAGQGCGGQIGLPEKSWPKSRLLRKINKRKLPPEKSRRGLLQQLSSQRRALYGTMRKCQGKEDVTRKLFHTAPVGAWQTAGGGLARGPFGAWETEGVQKKPPPRG